MLPTPTLFESHMSQFGVRNDDHVVIYDSFGVGPACRVYYTFKVFGHERVSVLDGGLPKWIADGRETTGEITRVDKSEYKAEYKKDLVRDYKDILEYLKTRAVQISDARPEGRFKGTAPEPRPGLKSGHMPGAVSIPSTTLIHPETRTLLPLETIKQMFRDKGVDLEKPIVNSCGSGVTASVLFFAQDLLGVKNMAVYDGSWSEYAAIETSEIVTEK